MRLALHAFYQDHICPRRAVPRFARFAVVFAVQPGFSALGRFEFKLLIRWWEQRQSLLRPVLFMLGAALTFKLGRDISLLMLWPIIFAYFFVRVTEVWAMGRFGQLQKLATVIPANTVSVQVLAGWVSNSARCHWRRRIDG